MDGQDTGDRDWRLSRRQALRLGAFGALAAGASSWLAACSSSGSTGPQAAGSGGSGTGGNLTIALNGESETAGFNQCLVYDGGSQFPSSLIFSRLTAMDYGPEFAIHPQLAKSWDVSSDAREYVFYLEEKATWHDGKPVTSADVKTTFEGIVANDGPASSQLSVIKTIETPDDYTVRLILSEPTASLLYDLSEYPETSILPAHLYAGTNWKTNKYNMQPVGSGPYKFVSYSAGEQIVLAANKDYFGGAPTIAEVAFPFVPTSQTALAGLQSNQFQALAFPPDLDLVAQLRKDSGIAVEAPNGPWACYLAFNVNRKPLSDLAVRKAITTAIDRASITQKVTFGVAQVSTGPFVASTPWAFDASATYPATSLSDAASILDAAGYKADSAGTRLTLDLYVSSNDFYGDVAQVLKSQLGQIGIVININMVDRETFLSTAPRRDYDMAIDADWIGPDPDEWYQTIGTKGAYNRSGYSNSTVDDLFVAGDASSVQSVRAKSYYAIQQIMLQDLPYTNIFAAPYSFAHRSDYTGWFSQAGTISYRLDITKVRHV